MSKNNIKKLFILLEITGFMGICCKYSDSKFLERSTQMGCLNDESITDSTTKDFLHSLSTDTFNVVLNFLPPKEVANIMLLSKSVNKLLITSLYWKKKDVVVEFIDPLSSANAKDYYCNICLENCAYEVDLCESERCSTLNRAYVQKSKIPNYVKNLYLKFRERDYIGWQEETRFLPDSGLVNLKNVIKLCIDNFSFFLINDWPSLRFLYLNVGSFSESLNDNEEYEDLYLAIPNLNATNLEYLYIQDEIITSLFFDSEKFNKLKTLHITIDGEMFLNQDCLTKNSYLENMIITFSNHFNLCVDSDSMIDNLYLYDNDYYAKTLAPFQAVFQDGLGLRSIITYYDNLKSLNLEFIKIEKRNFPDNLDTCSFINNSIEHLKIVIKYCEFVDFNNILPIFQNLKHLEILLNIQEDSKYYEFQFRIPRGLKTVFIRNCNTEVLLQRITEKEDYKIVQCEKGFIKNNKHNIIFSNKKNTKMPSNTLYIKSFTILII